MYWYILGNVTVFENFTSLLKPTPKLKYREKITMSSNSGVFVVIGCGPGIGLATAKLFATNAFDKIVLIARDSSRLESHRAEIEKTTKQGGKQVTVKCLTVDLMDRKSLNTALKETESLGRISCVLFNAARVAPSELLKFDEDSLIEDFIVSSKPRLRPGFQQLQGYD